jgi:hypothetical protein
MAYWDGLHADKNNLRLFQPGTGWRSYDDVKDADGRITAAGSNRDLDVALTLALNATNLVVLTGAGSSFSAKNKLPTDQQAPGMSDLWDAVQKAVPSVEFAKIFSLLPKATSFGTNIEKLLTQCKLYVELFEGPPKDAVSTFINDAEAAISSRVNFLKEDTDLSAHMMLLQKIARRGLRKPRAKVFTTNYDLCFEWAARGLRFTVVDGFSHSVPQVYDRGHFSYDLVRRETGRDNPDYVENVFQLYKLHGSIDWRRKVGEIIRSPDSSLGEPVLIFPRDSKYQDAFDPPFLDMMGALQSTLREPDTALIISGFGFNDDHISKPILAAVEANMSLRLVIGDVAFLEDAPLNSADHVIPINSPLRSSLNPYFTKFKQLAAIGDQRLTLINGRFEDLASGLPDLVAQTERERHVERLRVLHGDPLKAGRIA